MSEYSNENINLSSPPPFFFYNCIFNALVPILTYFQIDYEQIFLHYFPRYDMENGKMEALYEEDKELYDILNDMGIEIHKKTDPSNIVQDTIESLHEGKPVIVWADSYYQSNILDTYHTTHKKHCFLVKGVQGEYFQIIDHSYEFSKDYKECMISFRELESCAKAYVDQFETSDFPVFSALSYNIRNANQSTKRGLKEYFDMLKQHSGDIIEGHNKVQSYVFEEDELITLTNNMINYKTVICDVIKKIDPEISKLYSANLKEWKVFRVYLIRTQCNHQYQYEDMKERIAALCENDYQLYKSIVGDF